MNPEVFLRDIAAWLGRPYPGAAELLNRLRKDHHVSCLSNCNELHWSMLTDFLGNFDSIFSSHLLGEIKPDEDAFLSVTETLGVQPAQVRFFDDVRVNVEAGRDFGFRAFMTVGFQELQRCLQSEGLL
jgi:putative hydrolase of the HAD superfamily